MHANRPLSQGSGTGITASAPRPRQSGDLSGGPKKLRKHVRMWISKVETNPTARCTQGRGGGDSKVRAVQDLGDPQVDENSRIIEGLLWETCIRESSAFDWTRCTEMRANTSAHREVLRPSSPKTRHATDQHSRSASNPVPSSVKFSGTSERAGSFKSWPSPSKLKCLLPQWGFEASANGIAVMCLSIAALRDAEVDAKTLAINHLLSRSGTLHLPRHPEPPVPDNGAF